MKRLILASGSPRRREILKQFGYEFEVQKSNYEEKNIFLSPYKTARFFALNKAKDVFNKLQDKKGCVVLGADTVVYYKGKILGKPQSKEDAYQTLKNLSGKSHKVITGYSIILDERIYSGYVVSKVFFNHLTDNEITEYVNSGLPMDKAGSYGIQDGYNLVKKYKGSLNNIIGLPIEKIQKTLKKELTF